jgi:single-stranded DNA-binding protein
VWTTIVAFDKRAEAVKQSISKGEQVQVVGYLHHTERKMRDGSIRQVDEVYAVVVKPVKTTSADPNDSGVQDTGRRA